MKEWVVLSGKGGTGKTSVAAALAHLAAGEMSLVLADADVDAANMEIVLSPSGKEAHDFSGGQLAVIATDACSACGVCARVCRFGAIVPGETYSVDTIACEGCAACFYQCPTSAISMEDEISGQWFHSQTWAGPLFHARLMPGRENSGKLVTQVKASARLAAKKSGADLLIVDGPPGIGCPVIAAVSGAHLALLVVEPTVSGSHDLERILATTQHFQVPAAVCVNKADLNPEQTEEIARACAAKGVPLLGRIPFDEAVVKAMVNRQPVTACSSGEAASALADLWQGLRSGFL